PQATTPQPPGKDLQQQAAKKETTKPDARAKDEVPEALTISGRVLGPDGQPVPGAKLYQAFWVELLNYNPLPAPQLRGTSGPDGRFHIAVSKAGLDKNPTAILQIVAVADGFGPDWVQLDKPDVQEWTLRLAKDDVPITGRILDLEGRPIPGATIWP